MSWRGGVFYQIYPRSFADSDGDGVGDLRGAIAKLDHVASLGVDGVWLSPVFRSPMRDYGYDVSDYRDVDPLFGTLADLDAFIARAHALGLKVILDQVYAHSSDAHPWFVESRASRENPKANFYVWADAKADGSPPNNWQALFGGPAWAWDARRRQYYLHHFLPSQPALNVRDAAVQEELLDVARFWFARGVDGLRLDVANFYVADALLRDDPAKAFTQTPAKPVDFLRHVHSRSQPETLAFLARLRALADSFGDRFLLGEIEDDEALARQKEYVAGADRLNSAYSFFLLRAKEINPKLIAEAMAGWSDAGGFPSWSFSNHDVMRFATRLAQDDPARVRQLMALLLALPGAIFLYQGDELGLPHADVPFDRLRDPEAIAFWPHGIGRDGARTPMPWAKDAPNAGFSAARETWLPLDPRHAALAVDAQEADPASLLHFTRGMIALRKAHAALRDGAWETLEARDAVLMFARKAATGTIVGVFNLSAAAARVPAQGAALASVNGATLDEGAAMLPPWSGLLLSV